MPLLVVVAPGQGTQHGRLQGGRQKSEAPPVAAATARVHTTLQQAGVTVRTSLAILHASVNPVHQRKHAADVAVRTAARLQADLVSEKSVGLELDHPLLTPGGALLLEKRLERCRTELADLITGGHGSKALEITTLIWDELRGLEAVLLSARILAHRGSLPWVELGSRVRVETPEGELTVLIVHPIEAVLDAERISSLSPLAQALLGRCAGEMAEVAAPCGHYRVRILAVGAGEPTARGRGRTLDPVRR
ncbi:GreA/GreB family elongation factor [Blastococcus sp. PRF04-17]|uniref:GreA/GreB family elongation factor n=1 Tax=Blastococcus sp. PRF04-17 TaxID=2933797 RepID=UPI001FF593BD|nr:GreA/GreB family elongation factor [Blastococcus sp. PRF04-17]UOX99952.1 GreA/GreB family elongation factor [Blastococcus sp. PRF04-17]